MIAVWYFLVTLFWAWVALAVYCLLYVAWRWLFPIRCRVCTYPAGRPICLDCKSIEEAVAEEAVTR